MSMSRKAARAALRAPSTTASGAPTKVYTVRLVEGPASTSSRQQPGVWATARPMVSITCESLLSRHPGSQSTAPGESRQEAVWEEALG